MLSSVQCGLKHLPGKADAMMVLLGDQPLVDAGTINRLLRAYRRSARDILIATYQGRRGHPVLISRKYFDEILALAPEKSLRDLLSRHAGDIDEVESGQPGVLIDIDTKEEYQEEIHKLKQRI